MLLHCSFFLPLLGLHIRLCFLKIMFLVPLSFWPPVIFFLTKGAMICCYTLFILLDWIQNYLGSISLSVPVRVFPDEGKLSLNMSITTPWAGGPDFIKRAKEENTINTNAPPNPHLFFLIHPDVSKPLAAIPCQPG